MFTYVCAIDDEIFATIILKSKRDSVDDINLYEPVGSKTAFKELAVSITKLM